MNDNLVQSKGERERQERFQSSRRKKLIRTGLWLVFLAAVVAGSYGVIGYSKKSESRKPGEAVADQGALHIGIGQEHPPYNSNPPTSGPHYAEPANWGLYDTPLPDEQLIHNLEHGGIWISYRDVANQELVNQLRDIVGNYSVKVIVTPRPQNDSEIAVAAWGRLLKLEEFDGSQIKDFIKAFINKGPEQVPF